MLGEYLDVFSLPELPPDTRELIDTRGGASAVFILPSLSQDFRLISLTSRGTERISYTAPTIAATAFLTLVRGLPLMDVKFETPVGTVKALRPENDGKCYAKLRKCKLIYSNKPIFVGDVKICVDSFYDEAADGNIRIFEVADSECVDGWLLRALSLSLCSERVLCVCAYSLGERGYRIKCYSPWEEIGPEELAVAAVATRLCQGECSDGCVQIFTDDGEHSFLYDGGELYVGVRIEETLTLISP